MTGATEINAAATQGVSDSMALLAARIARDIFACGDDPRLGKVQRLQFMGGQYPNAETSMGGLSEYSLRCLIARTLAANARHNRSNDSEVRVDGVVGQEGEL